MDVGIDVETYLGRPAKTTDPGSGYDWKAEMEGRWQALGRRIFVGALEKPPRLAVILDECEQLASIWALVQNEGNLTGASRWIACSRRKLRGILHAWLRDNPDLIPMPLVVFLRWSRGKEKEGSDER
jgi:hypothetical protein